MGASGLRITEVVIALITTIGLIITTLIPKYFEYKAKKEKKTARARENSVLPEQYYQIRIIHDSGGQKSYLYEFNKSKELAINIILQIEKDVPSFPFGGTRRVMPGRIADYKVFVRSSPFETSEESLRSQYLHGYDGDFGGTDVTLEITRN